MPAVVNIAVLADAHEGPVSELGRFRLSRADGDTGKKRAASLFFSSPFGASHELPYWQLSSGLGGCVLCDASRCLR
ncbi:MAG: hypothetical protein JNM56_27605 [Planctomycetia bacterium]|nr:hypothetical protein [Planctomycetia bacterium]